MEEELYLATEITTENARKLAFEAGCMLLSETAECREDMRTYVASCVGGLIETAHRLEEAAQESKATEEPVMTFDTALKSVMGAVVEEHSKGMFIDVEVGRRVALAREMVVDKLAIANAWYDGGEDLPSIDTKAGIRPLEYLSCASLTLEHAQGLIFNLQAELFPEGMPRDEEDMFKSQYLTGMRAVIEVRANNDPDLQSGKKPLDMGDIIRVAHEALALSGEDVEGYASQVDILLAQAYVQKYLR
jgi:hypothetical protein